jgi:hypothetical protein
MSESPDLRFPHSSERINAMVSHDAGNRPLPGQNMRTDIPSCSWRLLMRHIFLPLACATFFACSPRQDLSGLHISQTTISEPEGSDLVVCTESGGVVTQLLRFTVGKEQPTLFVQNQLPDHKMWVVIATSKSSESSDWVPDLFDGASRGDAYGRKRVGKRVVLWETWGDKISPPNTLFVAPYSSLPAEPPK